MRTLVDGSGADDRGGDGGEDDNSAEGDAARGEWRARPWRAVPPPRREIALLKVDVEGEELEVLRGLDGDDGDGDGGGYWPRVRQVVAEAHDVGARLAQLRSLLERRGFEVGARAPFGARRRCPFSLRSARVAGALSLCVRRASPGPFLSAFSAHGRCPFSLRSACVANVLSLCVRRASPVPFLSAPCLVETALRRTPTHQVHLEPSRHVSADNWMLYARRPPLGARSR